MTGVISGVMTLLLIILFLGIVFWAYSKRNKPVFEEMA
ncbi:MAG: CcoQ/FixQ family Cbb3-type cytochrome c oxidase assembly chaperone, partial [Thiolinea sp.]